MIHVLGVDLGTTAVKAALFDEAGRTVASATEEYSLNTPSPLVVELEAEVYWQAFRRSLRRVMEVSRIRPTAIRAIGISAQGETLIALDREGQPVRPAIVWMDNRAQEESEFLGNHFGSSTIHAVTGQVGMLPMWPAAKILWLRRNEKRCFDQTAHFVLVEDYLIHRLSGALVAEGSLLCSTTYWNLNTRRYWPEMLQALGIGEQRLPQIREPGEIVGTLLPEAAAELGLSAETVVTTGALDQACGAIGVGNVRPGIFSECTGSNVAVVALVERPTIDPHRQLPCFYYGLPGTYMMHAFSMTGGMVLRWFRDAFCAQEMSASRSAGRDPYDALTELAASIAPGAEGLTVLPHFQGAGPPESNPLARGVLYGLSLHHGRAHVIRAILESIAMIVHRMIDAMRAMGIEVSEIRCLGGGAKSSLWCQIKADLNELPVSTMQNTEDAACFGAALLAGAATGVWPSVPAAAQALIRPARRYEPDPGTRDAYRRAYDLYTRAYQALEPVFAAPAIAVGRGASMNQDGGS